MRENVESEILIKNDFKFQQNYNSAYWKYGIVSFWKDLF